MQFVPSNQLSFLVKHFLTIETTPKDIQKFRLFSDGNVGMVFSFKNRLISGFSTLNDKIDSDFLPISFVYGQLDIFKNIFCYGQTSLLIVVFHPHRFHWLLGIHANELINKIIDLRLLFAKGGEGEELTNRLFECASDLERIQIIELFLIALSKNIKHEVPPLILSSIDYILSNRGLITVDKLIQNERTTPRNLDRKFMESIGIAPRRFANIVKQNIYLKGLRDRQRVKLADLAYETGYYDYAHAFREFKKITGVTPHEYIAKFNALALNLLQFPENE